MKDEVHAAIIGSVAALVTVVVGAVAGDYFQSGSERSRADLADLRLVLDDTARHVALGTRAVEIVRDRCFEAFDDGTPQVGGARMPSTVASERLHKAIADSRLPLLDVRVDRERLGIRLRNPELLGRYERLDRALADATSACRGETLPADTKGTTKGRLDQVDNLTKSYYNVVVDHAGTRLP
jgi:hypothetical protein